MRLKIFKRALPLLFLLAGTIIGKAQTVSVSVNAKPLISVSTSFSDTDLQSGMNELAKTVKTSIRSLAKNINTDLKGLNINMGVSVNDSSVAGNINIAPDINLNLNLQGLDDDSEPAGDNTFSSAKYKNYSKSYALDAKDRIRLSNQYGRITVNTWDRHEVKVDVQIKAEADDDGEAQKLLNGVEIIDSKNGGQVSFRTEIEHQNGNSWSIFNWGHNKTHKLTINYTVFMPVKTDLNVEDSYGAIILPDLDGKVKITSSYGSVTAKNLNNAANEIEGSYGNMHAAAVNGAHVDYSYGNLDMEQCNTLHADLSYGSFKIGKLTDAGDLSISYVGGFKIGELSNSFTRLNINSDYSSIVIGLPNNNSFNFDVTTTYGGFNFNNSKVTLTTKPSADGRHYSTTKTYKGYLGKSGSEARVNIQTNYGSVNFE